MLRGAGHESKHGPICALSVMSRRGCLIAKTCLGHWCREKLELKGFDIA